MTMRRRGRGQEEGGTGLDFENGETKEETGRGQLQRVERDTGFKRCKISQEPPPKTPYSCSCT